MGEIFLTRLNEIKSRFPEYISCVSGKGLVAALIFLDPKNISLCDIICESAMRRGLLVVHTGRESIKLAPPLTITKDALLEGLQVLEETIAACITGGVK